MPKLRLLRSTLCPMTLDRGVKSFEQRQTPHITDEDPPARAQRRHRALQHSLQIRDTRQILRHRVDDDRVKTPGLDAREVISRALRELNVGQILSRRY